MVEIKINETRDGREKAAQLLRDLANRLETGMDTATLQIAWVLPEPKLIRFKPLNEPIKSGDFGGAGLDLHLYLRAIDHAPQDTQAQAAGPHQ